jgi:hypothetical protein
MIIIIMSFTNNYSQSPINESIKTYEELEDNTTLSNRSFHLNLKIDVSLSQLEFQANIFSENFKTHGYINFFRVLRVREDQVKLKLKNLYIYSFVKCLHNGVFYHRISNNSDMGFAMRGHAAYFNLLTQTSQSGKKNETLLTYSLDVGTNNYKKALLVRLISKYPFLKDYTKFTKDSLGTFPFFIQEYEAYFSYLTEDYYSRDHVQQGEQDLIENSNATGRSRGLRYTNGKLHVVRMDQKQTSSILSFNNNPLMNSFYSADKKKYLFIPVSAGKSIVNNPSFFFSKANFIKLASSQPNEKKIERIYRDINVNEKLEHVVCYEVYTNTGILCSFLPVQKSNSIKVPSLDTILQYLSKLENLVNVDILVKLSEATNIDDLELYFEEYIESLVKSESQ